MRCSMNTPRCWKVRAELRSTLGVALLAAALCGGSAQAYAQVGEFDPRADPAYGAYQRGYYLTAFALALERAKAGNAAAQTLIASLYERGLGVRRDMAEARAWYRLAADGGDAAAQFSYAMILLSEGGPAGPNGSQARYWLEKSAAAENAAAAFNLGQLIVALNPGPSGYAEAIPHYRSAANAGIADAQYKMAQIHAEGLGVPQDNAAAREWMEKAARSGFDSAQVELGLWLADGRFGPKDEKAAFGWMQRAAQGGNVLARNRLAKMLALGIGVEPDPQEAAKWAILSRRAGLSDPWLDDFLIGLEARKLEDAQSQADRFPSN
jgi:TPR repeat protein